MVSVAKLTLFPEPSPQRRKSGNLTKFGKDCNRSLRRRLRNFYVYFAVMQSVIGAAK
jgi:hypothetical protein